MALSARKPLSEFGMGVILFARFHPGSGELSLTALTNFFRSTPDGYDRNWNPEQEKNEEQEQSFESEIRVSVNPGCEYDPCSLKNGSVGITVANLTVSDNPQQDHEFHWVWSVIGHPIIQAAVTPLNSVAHIDWGAIFGLHSAGHAIDYNVTPIYSSAIMMTRLIEFNDTDNTGRMDSPENMRDSRAYNLVNFTWERVLIENSADRVAIQLVTNNYTQKPGQSVVTNGTLNLTLSGYSDDGFGRWLPHLSHSRKTNQFDIQLQGIETNSGFNCSRFGLELVIVSYVDKHGPQGTEVKRQNTTTLDDEHTPGIFTTEELIMPGINDSLKSYMQWRPIVYLTMERELSSSTGLHVMPAVTVENPLETLSNSIMYILYGMDLDQKVVKAVNISFGIKDDGFYNKTQYHAWTFTFGTGAPIRNGLSSKIILTIIALVLVTLITIGVGLGFCIHNRVKTNKNQNTYSRMNDTATPAAN